LVFITDLIAGPQSGGLDLTHVPFSREEDNASHPLPAALMRRRSKVVAALAATAI
jgi:hypothetical protein